MRGPARDVAQRYHRELLHVRSLYQDPLRGINGRATGGVRPRPPDRGIMHIAAHALPGAPIRGPGPCKQLRLDGAAHYRLEPRNTLIEANNLQNRAVRRSNRSQIPATKPTHTHSCILHTHFRSHHSHFCAGMLGRRAIVGVTSNPGVYTGGHHRVMTRCGDTGVSSPQCHHSGSSSSLSSWSPTSPPSLQTTLAVSALQLCL